ncbi:LysR family transcriptional regulator [Sneathiella chinensis]|uniref:LysR family transcriptional regulator n=1 Tax=Sneathiella chinensis TaxID=349750 RepID=A0ABQ5U5G0_9PROT|nr:LysR family transcriptional regulator [Sneathiella chinensis]GLQ06552.1 LysR family transcriptional regulator [Sneathiella chinensis]
MSRFPTITLQQWALFNAVIDHDGYLKAAEHLNRSHSSLHHAIAKLQDQLGLTLITVEGKKLKLTPIGTVLRRRSQQLLKDADELETFARLAKERWEPEITIAVENIFPKHALTPALHAFRERNQSTRLRIDEVVLNSAIEAIEEGKADIVIAPYVPSGYLGTPLTHMVLYPYAHKDHPLIKAGRPATQKELAGSLQLVISDKTTSPRRKDMGWLKSEQRWTVSSFEHAREILLSGTGFCWAPKHVFADAIERGDLKIIETRHELHRSVTLCLVVPKADQAGPGTNLMADLIRAEARKALPPLPEGSRITP